MPPQAGWGTGLELPFGFVASVVWQIETDDGFLALISKQLLTLMPFGCIYLEFRDFYFFLSGGEIIYKKNPQAAINFPLGKIFLSKIINTKKKNNSVKQILYIIRPKK